MAEDDPDGEIDGGPRDEKRRIQVRALLLQYRIGRHGRGRRPGVKLAQAENERQKERGHREKSSHGGFERALDHEAPPAAHEVMQHQDGEAAERNTDPKNIGDQVRAEELLRIEERSRET